MKPEKLSVVLVMIFFLLSTVALAHAKSFKNKERFKKGEVLVRYKASTPRAQRRLSKNFSIKKIKTYKKTGIHHLKLPKSLDVESAIAILSQDPNVEYAEPNYVYSIHATPDDEHFIKLWGLHNTGQVVNGTSGTLDADIDAPEAWDRVTNATDVVVAVVDSGVDYNHEDLSANIWVNEHEIPDNGIDDDGNGKIDDVRGWDFVNTDNDPMDDHGHGTHVAGTIGAVGNNGIGVTGVAWNTKIMVIRGLDAAGRGYTSDLIEAIEYASDKGADVINLSWGGEDFSQGLKDAIDSSSAVVVCAAGNDSDNTDNTPQYPASYDCSNIISVAALDKDDDLASFSNFGATSVDVGAPGVNIYSTLPARKILFEDDFDPTGINSWTTGGTYNNWEVTGSKYTSSPYSLADSPSGNSPAGTDAWIQSPTLDLSSETYTSIIFDYNAAFSSGDRLNFEVSFDGINWTEVDSTDNSTGKWVETAFNLEQLQGFSQAAVRIRMISTTGNSDGCYIDDVKISSSSSTYGPATYGYKSGTSMAAPHVAGIAAMVKAMKPEYTSQEIKASIEDNIDPLSSLSGKCLSGGRVNLNNLVSLFDPITMMLSLPASANEGDGTMTGLGMITASRAPDNDLTVTLSSSDTSEVTVPAQLNIPAGQTTTYFDIDVIDDSLLDGSQSVKINSSGSGLGNANSSITIHDDETAVITIEIPDNATEGDNVLTGLGVITIDQTVDDDVSVILSSDDTTEISLPGSITIYAGQTSAAFDLTILEDNEIDGPQTATVTASVAGWVSGSDAIDVYDNENLNLVVTIPSSATEGDGQLAGQGTISISGTFASDLTVDLASDDITEVTVLPSVVLSAGQTSATFDLTIIDDAVVDSSQSVTITASSPGWVSGGQIMSVHDNDPGQLQFSSSTYTANEVDGVVSIRVIRTVSPSGTISVDYTTDSGTALVGEDFVSSSGTLTFADGETEKIFDIIILEDIKVEGTEILNLTLSNPGGGAELSSPGTASVLITDNDYQSPPYTMDFSDGLPTGTDGWEFYSSNAYGRIQVINQRLRMDSSPNFNLALNEAVLSLNLSGFKDVQLDFFQAEVDGPQTLPDMFTGHYNGDGIAISNDGTTWYTIVNATALDVGFYGQIFSIDLDAEVTRIQTNYDPAFGYTSGFKIKFQQYGYYSYMSGGRDWDNISIAGTPTFFLTIPNNTSEGDGTLTNLGEVSLVTPAPEDTIINLTSDDSSEVFVPATVTVLSGQSLANFDITIVDDSILDGTQPVIITVSGPGYLFRTGLIQVHDNETATLTLDIPANATEGDGTISGQGIVSVSPAVDEDVVVFLQSDDTSELMVPESVTIPAGQTSAAFDLSIVDDNVIDGSQEVMVSAFVEGWGAGSDTMTVTDDDKCLEINVPSQTFEWEGLHQDAGQISIVSPQNGDLVIELVSDDTSEITVPPSITLPAGQTSISFDITIIDDGILDRDKNVTITASLSGWLPGTATILVIEGAFRISPEFQVSTNPSYSQSDSSIFGLKNGGFVVTWTSYRQDGIDNGVFGQILDSSGIKVGEEFQVNTYTTKSQGGSSVAGLGSGGFVVTWTSDGQDGNYNGIFAQMFDSSGNKVGTEFQVNTYISSHQLSSSVAGLESGNFVVTWTSYGQDGSQDGIYGQVFDSFGIKNGVEFQVNTYISNHQLLSSVAGLESGGFVVTWSSYGQDGSVYGIFGQMFDSTGTKTGTEFQVNSYISSNQSSSSATGLENGGFVVAWTSYRQDGDEDGIYGQVFDSSGIKTGVEFQVNTYTTKSQGGSSVAGLENGGFVITWHSYGQDGDSYGTYGQMFDSFGIKKGLEFQVNTYTYSNQFNPSISSLENGDFVIAWQSGGPNTSGWGIFAQIFAVDTDMDFLSDSLEAAGCTGVLNADSDDDGIMDGDEDVNQNGMVDSGETDPCNPDSDDDGLDDGLEDINGNGLQDAGETSPLNPDSDNDGMLDGYEVDNQLDPLVDDSMGDKDNDGYSNYRESIMGTSANDGLDIPAMIADFDSDLDVDAEDLMLFVNEYGRTDCITGSPCTSDMNNDGNVDDVDLSFIAEDMGRNIP